MWRTIALGHDKGPEPGGGQHENLCAKYCCVKYCCDWSIGIGDHRIDSREFGIADSAKTRGYRGRIRGLEEEPVELGTLGCRRSDRGHEPDYAGEAKRGGHACEGRLL